MQLAYPAVETVTNNGFRPASSKGGRHSGLDYAHGKGYSVKASAPGTVVEISNNGSFNQGWGNRVVLDHGNGIRTSYSHFRSGTINVSLGQSVSTGQLLGTMGSTGTTTGDSLHFELYLNWHRINPEPYFTQDLPGTSTVSGSVSDLASAVLRGEHGNGQERRNALGSLYSDVMDEVNRRLEGGTSASVDIGSLATQTLAGEHGNGADRRKALGSNYDAVMDEVNRRLAAAPSVDINSLAKQVIAGKFGNGPERRKALGSNYDAVQAEVNRILPKVDISALAKQVIDGGYGNGAERRKALGSNYDAVQAEVNKILAADPQAKIVALAVSVIAGNYGNGAERRKALGLNYDAVMAEVNRRV